MIVLQRFHELASVAARLVERHSRHGPPMLHYFALGMQGYAAQYRGRHEEAKRLFDAAEEFAVPAGTYRVLKTVQARPTFEHGKRIGACRILHDNIEVLLDSDYTDVTRLTHAARVLPYLDTTGDFATMARTHLVAEQVRRIEADPTAAPHLGADPDARVALIHMRDVLEEILEHERRP